ncbi:MAG: glutarate dioxygenase GlaH [Acidiferrobacterales bacterium]
MEKLATAGAHSPEYHVEPHPQHARIQRVVLSDEAIDAIVEVCAEYDVLNLEYTPFARLVLAGQISKRLGEPFVQLLRQVLHDRATGGLTLGLQGRSDDPGLFVIFATAITHLVGIPNFDAMTGKYYARFVVQHEDNSDSYLRKAYRKMYLHTDGTYVNEVTDWLMMMKMAEHNARGGRSRLLHLDDWEELDRYSRHPLATHPFTYKAPPSKNVDTEVKRQTFFPDDEGRPCLCFIDQFVYPETREQGAWLSDMLNSMEASPATKAISLPVGEFVMLNNRFWAHGREAFEPDVNLVRELMRLRGYFADT